MHVYYNLSKVSNAPLSTILSKELQGSWQSLGPTFQSLELCYILTSADLPCMHYIVIKGALPLSSLLWKLFCLEIQNSISTAQENPGETIPKWLSREDRHMGLRRKSKVTGRQKKRILWD